MKKSLLMALSLCALAVSSTAVAQTKTDDQETTKYAGRHMTTRAGQLNILAGPANSQFFGLGDGGTSGLSYTKFADVDMGPLGTQEIDPFVFANLGVAYGITNELEAGLLLPLLLSSPVEEADVISTLPLFATYAVKLDQLDVGGRVMVSVPISEGTDLGVSVGVPVNYRMGDMRLETGLFVPLTLGDETGKALNVPVRFAYNLRANVFLGAQTGLELPDFEADMGAIPLSVFGGYSMRTGSQIVDVGLSVGYPRFISLMEGAENPGTDIMNIATGVNVQMGF